MAKYWHGIGLRPGKAVCRKKSSILDLQRVHGDP